MTNKIARLEYPELFFGIVAPIGVDIRETVGHADEILRSFGYQTVIIKVTSIFTQLHNKISLGKELKEFPLEERYKTYIEYGDAVCDHFQDNSFFACATIARIIKERVSLKSKKIPEKVAYIMYQFKRKEEISILRSVYGRLFFQISIFTKRNSRVDILARKIANSHHSADHNSYRASAESLVRDDENEAHNPYGQRVGDIFHEADFIVTTDMAKPKLKDQVYRLVSLIFGSNILSPTKMEYGLYLAKAASIRSLDLSRQVGAAIFTKAGEIIALGSNEVPKAGGGTYWSDDLHDDRDYKRGIDSNYKRKIEILSELFDTHTDDFESLSEYRKSQFMDALEYGRMIHAEMSAICDAARLGRKVEGSVLYTTTFPCHMCAKHIVASGIDEVIFLEPYPKSLASELHSDSVHIEGQSREQYDKFPATSFSHFYGISPKRYRELFERNSRKGGDGKLQERKDGAMRPVIDITLPVYLSIEMSVITSILIPLLSSARISLKEFPDIDFESASRSSTEATPAVGA